MCGIGAEECGGGGCGRGWEAAGWARKSARFSATDNTLASLEDLLRLLSHRNKEKQGTSHCRSWQRNRVASNVARHDNSAIAS